MEVSNYGQLKTRIADELNRTDLTTWIPGWVFDAEAHFNRKLRHPEMMVSDETLSISSRYTTLPADFLEGLKFELYADGGQRILKHVGAWTGVNMHGLIAGTPVNVTIVGHQIEVSPTPSGTFSAKISYWEEIPTITANDANTNWLLTDHHDMYLYRALMHGATRMRDRQRMTDYAQAYAAIEAELISAGKRKRHSVGMAVVPERA